jgi:hypothetical protein
VNAVPHAARGAFGGGAICNDARFQWGGIFMMVYNLDLLLRVFSLGFDSFLAGMAIGPIIRSGHGRAWCIALFGVCDGLATLLGAFVPHRLPDPPAAALYLLGVMLIIQSARHSRTWMFAMPFLFSLDNLAGGGTVAEAPMLAFSSAAMATGGIALGALGRLVAVNLSARGAFG